jgi:nitroreductase
VHRILGAARLAPSWENKQCWEFVVVRTEQGLQELRKATLMRWINAPCYVVGCGDPGRSGHLNGQDYYMVDVAIALEHLVLAATAEGVASCWVGGFREASVKRCLGIPDAFRVVALIALGYPATDARGSAINRLIRGLAKGKRRKELPRFVHLEKWERMMGSEGSGVEEKT